MTNRYDKPAGAPTSLSPLIKAAIALWNANGRPMKPSSGFWSKVSPESMDLDPYIEQARAVLEAVKEPSASMLDATWIKPGTHKVADQRTAFLVGRQAWQAMIEAALVED